MLELFHMTLRPLIDTYTVTAKCLHRLVDRQVPENDFVQEVLSEIKSQLSKGFCSYGESHKKFFLRFPNKFFDTFERNLEPY